MMTLFVFLICLAASTVGGICGIGGGVIIKPALDAADVMPVSAVSFLSGLTVLSMVCVNVYKNRRGGELDAGRSLPLGVGAAVGGIAGKYMFSLLKAAVGADRTVGALQAILLGLMVLGTLVYALNKNRVRARNVGGWILPSCIGLALGMVSAFLGIGGGPMNLAVLYYFFSMGTKKAAANSLLVILLSQGASLLLSLITGDVPAFEWRHLAAMVTAGVLGGLLSARMHRRLSERTADHLFIGLLAVIAAICAYNAARMLL